MIACTQYTNYSELPLVIEGAATNAEIKTLTEQNSRLKEAIVR